MNLVNKAYKTLLRFKPVHNLKPSGQVRMLCWCSDFTHVREQLPVSGKFTAGTVCFVSNKKEIVDYISRHSQHPAYYLNFHGSSISNTLARLFGKLFPNMAYALIGNDARDDDRTIARAIHRLHVQYGVITHGLNYLSHELSRNKANQFFVWSEEEAQRFISQGIAKSRIVTSGSPYFFSLFESHIQAPEDWMAGFRKLYAHNNKLTLLCLSGPGHLSTESQHIQLLQQLNDTAAEHNIRISANLHRKDKTKYYEGLSHIQVIADTDKTAHVSKLVPILSCADVVISGASTSVIEAMCMQKPVLFYDVNPRSYGVPYAQQGYVYTVQQPEALGKALQALLHNENTRANWLKRQQEFLNEYILHATDNLNPAARIHQFISTHILHDS